MCIFCKIVNKEIPSDVIFEDEEVMAILDVNPLTKGHTLVIPKIHYKNMFDAPKEVVAKLATTSQQIAESYLKEEINKAAKFAHEKPEGFKEIYKDIIEKWVLLLKDQSGKRTKL